MLWASLSWPSILMVNLLSRMKQSVHSTKFSFRPMLRIFWSRHPRVTLGGAAATSIRRAPVFRSVKRCISY